MASSDKATRCYKMAGEAAAEILSQKLEILLYRPGCLRCLLTEKLVKDAKEKLAPIQEFFSPRDRQSKSKEWLGWLLQAIYDAEECIDKFLLREACGRHKALHVATRPAAALVSKYKLWRDLSSLVKKMQELCQDQSSTGKGKKPASSFSPASAPWQGQKKARLTSYQNQQASYFLCRKEQREEIMRQIGGEPEGTFVNLTLILGEKGMGKTFLARWVYRKAMYLGVEWCAWVRVSASMEVEELLLEILKQMGKAAREETGLNLDKIKKMLYDELAKTKKFLIVLDDVQPSNEQLLLRFFRIIIYYRQGHIIITTRFDNLKFFKKTELEKLKDAESQTMLASKLSRVPYGKSLSDDKDILRTCGGSPLHLSLLGGLLSYAEERECKALVKDCSGLSGIVELSYHRLPVHLKPCFLYMALFPVASSIPTRRLVRLWLAEGLLDAHCYGRGRKPTRPPEDVGEAFILELVERNLIDVVSWRADGSPKACQMLPSLYEMIRPIMASMGFLHIHAASKLKGLNDGDPSGQQQQAPPQATKVRWLAEHTNKVRDGQGGGNTGLNLSHVSSFLSFFTRRGTLNKDISTFLGKMTSKTDYILLRVLDLEGVYKPSLHGVLHKLVLLRYLGLRSTVLDSIPREVGDLHHLETLDIKHTNITSLPSSLWKSRKLRHLHLNWFYINLKTILKACSNNAMALTELQTLSGLVIGEVRENLLTGHMDSLTTLKLFLRQSNRDTSGAAGKAVADWISSGLPNLQSLTFGVTKKARPAEEAEAATSNIGPIPELSLAQHNELLELYLLGRLKNPIWKQLLPDSLRVLTLSGSKVKKTDMIPQLGGLLTNLRTLRLLANSFLGKNMTFAAGAFPSLKILKIWKLPQLEEVNIQGGAMPHLKEVEFRHLDVLKTMEGIRHCEELETIWVVISRSHAPPPFLEQLNGRIGNDTYLHVEKDPEGAGSMGDEDDRDKKKEMSDEHAETTRPQPLDDGDQRDEKRETPDQHAKRERPQSMDDDHRDEKGGMPDQHAEKERPQSDGFDYIIPIQ